MLGIFTKKLVNPPQELNSPAPLNSSNKSKLPHEILQDFTSFNPSNAFSMNFGNDAILAYSPSNNTSKHHGYVTIRFEFSEFRFQLICLSSCKKFGFFNPFKYIILCFFILAKFVYNKIANHSL